MIICEQTRCSSHNARKKLLTTCQHRKHNITCLSDWPIYRCHSQLRQSSCPNLSCDQFSQSCLTGGKIVPGVYILPHKIIVTCEIIFFVYVAWRKICPVMSFSCSLKMFGWRQNSSRSGYFASWGKINTAWVIQKYRISALKIEKHRYQPKKIYRSSSNFRGHSVRAFIQSKHVTDITCNGCYQTLRNATWHIIQLVLETILT